MQWLGSHYGTHTIVYNSIVTIPYKIPWKAANICLNQHNFLLLYVLKSCFGNTLRSCVVLGSSTCHSLGVRRKTLGIPSLSSIAPLWNKVPLQMQAKLCRKRCWKDDRGSVVFGPHPPLILPLLSACEVELPCEGHQPILVWKMLEANSRVEARKMLKDSAHTELRLQEDIAVIWICASSRHFRTTVRSVNMIIWWYDELRT